MKRVKIFSVICILMTFLLTGCGSKTAITLDEFNNVMQNKGYTIQNVSSQFTEYENISDVNIAVSSDSKYQIEFYKLSDVDNAIDFFDNNKAIFEKSKSSASSESSVTMGNYSKYTLSTNGKYKVISRIDDTVVYLNVSDDYKDAVKEILEELGY